MKKETTMKTFEWSVNTQMIKDKRLQKTCCFQYFRKLILKNNPQTCSFNSFEKFLNQNNIKFFFKEFKI